MASCQPPPPPRTPPTLPPAQDHSKRRQGSGLNALWSKFVYISCPNPQGKRGQLSLCSQVLLLPPGPCVRGGPSHVGIAPAKRHETGFLLAVWKPCRLATGKALTRAPPINLCQIPVLSEVVWIGWVQSTSWQMLGLLCTPPPPPPHPVPRNRLAQEPPPGSAVEFSHHFFLPRYWVFHASGGCRTTSRCAGQHFMCVAISQSQAHIPLKPLPPALDPFPEATSP